MPVICREYQGGKIARPHLFTNILGERVILLPAIGAGRETLPIFSIRNLEDLKSYLDSGGKLHGILAYLEEINIKDAQEDLTRTFRSRFVWPEGVRVLTGERNYLLVKGEDRIILRNIASVASYFGIRPCQVCGSYVTSDHVHTDMGGEIVCDNCSDQVINCRGCGCSTLRQRSQSMTGRTGRYCHDCASDWHHCDDCDEMHETRYCPNADLDTIQDHGFAPAIVKKGNLSGSKFPFCIGMELELVTRDPVETLRHVRQKHGDLFWGVHDGSVDGVELVSQPATVEYWRDFSLSVPSHCQEGNAGIHLHACRVGFTHSQIKDILSLFAGNVPFIKTVAQRDAKMDQWARITDPEELSHVQNLADFWGLDKYSAINFQHKHTFEFRIFNSTKKNPYILKNIEFVASLWEWAKDGSPTGSAKMSNYLDFIKKTDFNYLKSFLIEKSLIPA